MEHNRLPSGTSAAETVRELNSRLLLFHSYSDWLGQFTMGTVTNSWIAISIST